MTFKILQARLLEMAVLLPNLLSPYVVGDDSFHMNFGDKYINIPEQKILDSQITSFGPLNPKKYLFIVETHKRRYRLQRCGLKGGFWYRSF
ncbi:hypothetical protein BDQ17DRAFT_390720 [Cyathus striatus]|nr:hypothetical protein BDQ17DRAFT_390720 [Cyathus striatus]